ncbi:hypothetical protein D3C73_1009020 [compost metagenome]
MFTGANLATQHQAIVARHHDVEHDQVYRRRLQERTHLPAIRDDCSAQTVLLQVVAYQFSDFAVIVHDENVIDMFHGEASRKGDEPQSIEPLPARPSRFVLQCICCVEGYTRTKKRQIYGVLYRCVSPGVLDTYRFTRAGFGHRRDTSQVLNGFHRGKRNRLTRTPNH